MKNKLEIGSKIIHDSDKLSTFNNDQKKQEIKLSRKKSQKSKLTHILGIKKHLIPKIKPQTFLAIKNSLVSILKFFK